MARVIEGDGTEPDALTGRKPRTDWLWRPGRIARVAALMVVLLMPAVRMLAAGIADERTILFAGVACAVPAFVWGKFAWWRVLQARRRRSAAAAAEPWRDHGYWSIEGEKRFVSLLPSRTAEKVRRLLGWTAVCAILAAFVLAFTARRDASLPTLGAGMLSLAVVVVTGMRGYANVVLVWRERPARIGEVAHYSVSVEPFPSSRFERIDLTLRCVIETPRPGGRLRPALTCPFSVTRRFADELPDGSVLLHARFDVPAGLPAADPLGEPAVFWELLVSAERPGSRFDETFLVPVYAALS